MSEAEAVPPPAKPSIFTTADERLSAPAKTNLVIIGKSDAGKTTLARTLPAEETLFVDLEAGTKALGDWRGEVIKVREVATQLGVHPWQLSRALACVMCGPDPAADPNDWGNPYSKCNYDAYCTALGGANIFDRFKYVFWDSATVAARHCFAWCQTQPEAFSEKTNKPDTRGAYGLHGIEMVRWLTTIQHIPNKSTIVAAILNEEVDDFKRVTYSLQIDGSKAKTALPGIFDNIATLTRFNDAEGKEFRALVCRGVNDWGFLAKDRSGALDMVEPPDLMHIIKKSSTGPRLGDLVSTMPDGGPQKTAALGELTGGPAPTGNGNFNPNNR